MCVETFVVRVWVPAMPRPATDPAAHGVVEHIPTQRSATFRTDGELMAFVHECLNPLPEDRDDQPPTERSHAPSSSRPAYGRPDPLATGRPD